MKNFRVTVNVKVDAAMVILAIAILLKTFL